MSIKDNRIKLLIIMLLTITFVYFGFQYVLPLFIPFIFAYIIARGLVPIVKFLNKKFHIPKIIASIITLFVVGTAIGWGLIFVFDILIKQVIVLLKNMPIYLSILSGYIDRLCQGCDKFLGIKLGTIQSYIYSNFDGVLVVIKNKIMPVITTRSLSILIGFVGTLGILLIIFVSIILFIKDDEEYKKTFRESIFYDEIHIVTSKLSQIGIAYLRTQGIMLVLIASICTGGMVLTKNKYALLIGMAIGIFDAFPVLGSGLILIPWGVIEILNKDLYTAAILFTMYLGCQIARQLIEPKLLGNRIGIKPVFTLMAMYAGIHIFGLAGVILGPIGLVMINTVFDECKKRLNLCPTSEGDNMIDHMKNHIE